MKAARQKPAVQTKRSKRGPTGLRLKSQAHAQVQAQQQIIAEFWREHGIYDLAPIGFLTLDRRGRILQFNQKAADLLGLPGTYLLQRPLLVFVAKHHVTAFVQFMTHSIRNPGPATIELDLVIDGRIVPIQVSMMTIGRETPVHEVAIVDLTEIRRAESWLQVSLAHWYSLVQDASDTIMTLDHSGRILFVNNPLWGYSVDALIGSHLLENIPEGERPKFQRSFTRVFNSDKRSECEITRIEGDRQLWFVFSFGPAKAVGKGGFTTLLIREITEQKRIEENLRASSDQLRDLAARIDAVREEERTRLAREIHDELGQTLTILKLDLSWVHGKLRPNNRELRKRMKGMIADVDDTIERVRRISSELRPSMLDDLGLAPAIEWQVAQIQKRTGIRTEVISGAEGSDLSTEASAATFRVVQEALTNVVRHAKATKVRVRLKSEDSAVRISIEDNGKGITDEQKSDVKSLGIVGMKERIARLGGRFSIFSEPGKGTRLDIIIPIQHD